MLERDPVVIVYNLLREEWNAEATPIDDSPTFLTGWYESNKPSPQVTVTNPDEGVMGGGEVGITGTTSAGGAAQYRSGTMLVNSWAGSYDDLENAGPNGGGVSPKQLSYDMAREVHRIMQENATGTITPNGDPELHSLAAGSTRKIVEVDLNPTEFRYETVVRYSYSTHTN